MVADYKSEIENEIDQGSVEEVNGLKDLRREKEKS